MSPHWPAQMMLYQNRPDQPTVIDVPESRYLSDDPTMMPGGGHTLTEQIVEGSFYELDRSKLPPRSPSLLRQSIRVVMVTVKTNQNLTVRYPSIESLKAYFANPSENLYPNMDEKFIMGSQLAAGALVRRIPSREFTRNSSSKAFWFEQTSRTDMHALPSAVSVFNPAEIAVKSKLGKCLSILQQSSDIMGWGERRLISYAKNVGKDSSATQNSSHSSLAVIVPKIEIQEEGEEIVEVIKSEVKEIKEEMEDDEVTGTMPMPGKRKRRSYINRENIETAPVRVKREVTSKIPQNKDRQNKDRDNIRWNLQRYEHAKHELLAVMKAKEASYLKPISRHELRVEARKHIGDTGLLDHLLKHVVDTLAPGGTERFRRRWDSQGVMEYWLESADLNDIRKKAGVLDPYWTPPSGWKPGDPICNHSSDCAAVIDSLKEELAQMRGEMQLMAAQKHGYTYTLENLSVESQNPAIFKEKYDDLLKEKARREQELMEISKSLKKMEMLMRKQSEGLDGY